MISNIRAKMTKLPSNIHTTKIISKFKFLCHKEFETDITKHNEQCLLLFDSENKNPMFSDIPTPPRKPSVSNELDLKCIIKYIDEGEEHIKIWTKLFTKRAKK